LGTLRLTTNITDEETTMTMHKLLVTGTVLAGLCGALVGCGVDERDGATVTTVRHNADGTTSVSTVSMNADELAALDAQREALAALGKDGAAASLDGSCAAASMWVYDQFGQTGNRICFAGPGTDFLASYAAPGGGNWSTANRSSWSGAYGGDFQHTSGSLWVFGTWSKITGPGPGYNRLRQF
jgi:hypothetical protein